MSGWCFDCGGAYRGAFTIHQSTQVHRRAVTPRRRVRREAPAWRYGTTHEPTEEHDRAWVEEHRRRTMQEALERIFELTGDTPSRGGGGKGQTMTVHYKGRAVVGHGGSKIAAITDLLHQVEDLTPTFDVPVPRASVDDALEQIRQVTGPDVEVLDEGERGAVWDRTNTRLVAIFPCAGECMVSKSPVCECECGGSNHGILVRLLSQSVPGTGGKPIMLGPKPCACGCGGTTNRKYVPGHDARHHAALKRAAAEAQA